MTASNENGLAALNACGKPRGATHKAFLLGHLPESGVNGLAPTNERVRIPPSPF